MSPIPLFVTWDLGMRNIWGLKMNWQHYRKVRITDRLHKNPTVIMSPESSSFDPVLERALVTQQGEPNFLPIVALMIRLAPTATKDNYMTVECRGVSWICDCHWVMAGLGPSELATSRPRHTSSPIWNHYQRLGPVLILPACFRLDVFDSISDFFSHPLFPALLSHNGSKWVLFFELRKRYQGRKVKRHQACLESALIIVWLNVVWQSFKFQGPNSLILHNSVVSDRLAW